MIVKMINDQGIWIPSVKLFLNIMKAAGLQIVDEHIYKPIIQDKFIEAEESTDPWEFKITFVVEVKSSKGPVPCNVRIIRNRDFEKDGCSAVIMFVTKTDIVLKMNMEYKFEEEDL